MYQEYLAFISDPKNKEMASEDAASFRTTIENLLFSMFLREYQRYNYELDGCILLDFPLPLIAQILEQYVSDAYAFPPGIEVEIPRLIYHLWPKYMNQNWKNYNRNFPHNKIFQALYTIKENLLEFDKFDSFNQVVERSKQRRLGTHKMGQPYYNWHMFAFFPLLGEEKSLPILMKVIKLPYYDAQDMLMFGLAQYDPKSFLPYLAKILEYWHINQNIEFCYGTGMIGQLKLLIELYKNKGVNVYSNPKIKEILHHYEIYEEI